MLRELPPVLLKCAGVVGLAAGIVMVIASAFTPIEGRLEAAPESRIAAAHEVAATQAAIPSALASDDVAIKRIAAPAATGAVQQKSVAVAQEPVLAAPPAVAAAAPEAAPLAIAAAPASAPPQPEPALVAGPVAPQPDTPDVAAADASAALPMEADCPTDAQAQTGDGTDCAEAAGASMPAVATALAEEPTTGDAAAALISEAANPPLALATVPKPRPDPPTAAPARVVKTAARGRLPPPPNCGSKHAHWRYNSARQPVWYCR